MRGASQASCLLLIGLCATVLSGCSGGGTSFSSASNESSPTPTPSPSPMPSPNPTPAPGSGEVVLSWDSPTTNVDQSCLNDLSGYRISYGVNSSAYTSAEAIDVNAIACVDSGTEPVAGCGNMRTCTYTVRGLSNGTWYLAVQAYDTRSNLSNFSNEVVRSLP